MTQTPRTKTDPLEREIERAIKPGASIRYHDCIAFVSDLDEVAARIAALTVSDPSRAVALFETCLAASYAKADELDDSDGDFGQFVAGLYCGWITARQAEGANPDETASRLLIWMDADDYGFCASLENDAAKVFDKPNLAAFVSQVRTRFDAAAPGATKMDVATKDRSGRIRRQWGATLRTLYLAQKNTAAYVALAEETDVTPEDCHAIATLLLARRKREEALTWLERGLDLHETGRYRSIADQDLTRLKRRILAKLGRGIEALESAWADYRRVPNKYTYDDLMKFAPKAERGSWHQKAMDAVGALDLARAIELLAATKELERLADLIRQTTDPALAELGHYTTEPVARKLEKDHPDLAARLWGAQGLRILNAKKSTYYRAALLNFESAQRCFARAGLDAEWQNLVTQVRAAHQRKYSFMPGFERLVAGFGPTDEPSFLDDAIARWNKRQGSTS